MSRARWGLWVLLAILAQTTPVSALAQDGQAVQDPDEPIDLREASFLPPPTELLKVPEPEVPAVKEEKPTPVVQEAPTGVVKMKTNFTARSAATVAPDKPKAEKKEPEAVVPKVDLTVPPASLLPAKTVQPDPVNAKPEKVEVKKPSVVVMPPAPSLEKVPAAPAQMEPVALGGPVDKAVLADVDPETLGVLSPENGGLGSDVWKDTDRLVVDRLMSALILPAPSPTLNDLARRLLLTTAAAPMSATSDPEPKRSLLAQRIEALMALGAVSDAWKLSSLAEPKLVDDVTLRLLTEAALIGPDSKAVCDKVPGLMAAHGKTDEEAGEQWQKSLLVCQLRAGDKEAVQLGVDVMREKGPKDALFLSLISKNILGESKRLPRQLTPLKPLNLALLRQIEVPLPPELYARASALMTPELLKIKSSDEAARVDLAERAAAKGFLTVQQVADVYQSISFDEKAITKANTQEGGTPLSRAMAYQALVNEQAPAKKIELVQKLVSGLSAETLTGTHASMIAGFLDSVPVSSDMNAFAVSFARYFALAGKPDKAMVWLKQAQTAAAQSPDLKAKLDQQWPLFVLSGLVSDGDYAQGLKAWLDKELATDKEADGEAVHAKRTLGGKILLLLNTSGYAVSEEAWRQVIEPVAPSKELVPSSVLVQRMLLDASAGHKGETLLLALLLSKQNRDGTPLRVKLDILKALRHAGFVAEAQAYAREILVGLETDAS
ncbi:MAG: hypothetical protein AB7E52_06055 [Bdellovibrionales bacterium]